MYEAGGWVLLESAIADLPVDLRWLFESGAVTIEQLAALHSTLGVTTYADLIAEVGRHAIQRVPGLDEAAETAIAGALTTLRATIWRIPLGRAMSIADPIPRAAARDIFGIAWAEPVGSLRRGQDMVGDDEIVAQAADPGAAFDAILSLPGYRSHAAPRPRRLYLLTDRVQIGIRCPLLEPAGAALLHLTGTWPTSNNSPFSRARADGRSSRKGSGGPRTRDRMSRASASPKRPYAALDLPWIPPEICNGDDEVAAAVDGRLLTLVSREDIRGDLHMHTMWSDGRDSIAAMVETCASLGVYEHRDHRSLSACRILAHVDDGRREEAGVMEIGGAPRVI